MGRLPRVSGPSLGEGWQALGVGPQRKVNKANKMKFSIVVFPGSNCDHDAYHAAKHVLGQEAEFVWHKETTLKGADVVVLPVGFSHGDYLRTGAIARFSPIMSAVKACTEKAAAEGMLSWLYDEDRWPSGAAGGLVTRDKQYRVRHFLWTATPYVEPPRPRGVGDYTTPMRTEDGQLLARYEVVYQPVATNAPSLKVRVQSVGGAGETVISGQPGEAPE